MRKSAAGRMNHYFFLRGSCQQLLRGTHTTKTHFGVCERNLF